MVANKYAFLQITRRRLLNEWEAFKEVISRRNIRRRITIPLTLSNLKLLRRITRTENILHRNFTRRQVAIQNRVASNIGISQSTFSVKVLNLFSCSRRKTNKSFPAPVEFIAAVIAYYVHPVNIQTACLIMEGAECTENIINGVERPVKAAELFAFTLRVRAGNTDVLTDAEENVRQKLRAEGVM